MTSRSGEAISKALAKFMYYHLSALKLANSDKQLIMAYEALIDHVKTEGPVFLEQSLVVPHENRSSPELTDPKFFRQMSLEEVAGFIESPGVSRKSLENVAIYRFGVPRGSMRKWGSRDALLDKILIMLRNERVHKTIGDVARAGRPYEPTGT